MKSNELIKVVKGWIIDMLDDTDRSNFKHNIGVVDGFERVLNGTQGYDTDSDLEIRAAYSRLNKRLGV